MNENLAEALRQVTLAEERAADVVRSAGHSSAAWDATDAAEREGVAHSDLLPLRLRLVRFAIVDWLPCALLHAASHRHPEERAEWFRGLAHAVRVGASWYERGLASGEIADDAANEVMAAWEAEIQRIEAMARTTVAS